jgi:hypothetical protein
MDSVVASKMLVKSQVKIDLILFHTFEKLILLLRMKPAS